MISGFIIWCLICLICLVIRTVFNIIKAKEHPLAENKKIVIVVYVAMGIFWFSWAQTCFFDPVKIEIFTSLRYAGLLLFIAGVLLFILSHTKLKGFKSGNMATTGIYSKIRNPMYLGFIIWMIGFPIFVQSPLALICSVIWIAFIIQWKITEEKELEKKYPAYKEYRDKTWF